MTVCGAFTAAATRSTYCIGRSDDGRGYDGERMSALTDRITAVLREAWDSADGGHTRDQWAASVAERIAALFTEETKPIIDPHWQDWCERILGYERRWVSEWTAVDPANQPEETP